jgi:hypothetical protein
MMIGAAIKNVNITATLSLPGMSLINNSISCRRMGTHPYNKSN